MTRPGLVARLLPVFRLRQSRGRALAVCGLMFFGVAAASAAQPNPQPNPQAVEQVLGGKQEVAHAAWWGFQPDDSTAALQAAINSGAKKVIVDRMESPWIVRPLQLASDQELHFEPGAEVLAKAGEFHGSADSLFAAAGKKNIKLTGPDATLRMRRADYDGPDYKHAEWRHVLKFHGCEGIVVEGLTLAESGGDGIYLGAGSGGVACRDVVIRDVVCDRNYRQGISVISAENLLIERCVLKGTAGTPPAAGIDFEPNRANERLTNCVMRDCVIEDNQGYAVHIYAPNLDGSTEPLSIRLENCVTRGANARSVSVVLSSGPRGPVKGLIELIGCRFEDVGATAVTITSTTPSGVKLRMIDCTLADPAEHPTPSASFLLRTRPNDLEPLGGIEFRGVTVRERVERRLLQYDDPAGMPLVDVTGQIAVERDGQRHEYQLDEATLAKLIPQDQATRIPRWPLKKTPLAVAQPSTFAGGKLPGLRVRGDGLFLLSAEAGQAVKLRLAAQPVGRGAGTPVKVKVADLAGKVVKQASIESRQESELDFTADTTGLYRVECAAGSSTTRVVASSHAILVASDGGPIHLLGTSGEFYFLVPAGVREFAVRFWGEGDLERVSAAVFDATGAQVWKQADISTAQSCEIRRDDSSRAEVWRFVLGRPTIGVLEDHYVEMRGMPTVFGFRADGLLTPVSP